MLTAEETDRAEDKGRLHAIALAHIIPLSSSAIPIFAFSPYLHSLRSLTVTVVSIGKRFRLVRGTVPNREYLLFSRREFWPSNIVVALVRYSGRGISLQ